MAPDQPPQIPPIKKVVWMKDGQVIETSGIRKYRHYRKQKILEIRDLNEMDSGLYECAASVNSTEKGRAELWSKFKAHRLCTVLAMFGLSSCCFDCLFTVIISSYEKCLLYGINVYQWPGN